MLSANRSMLSCFSVMVVKTITFSLTIKCEFFGIALKELRTFVKTSVTLFSNSLDALEETSFWRENNVGIRPVIDPSVEETPDSDGLSVVGGIGVVGVVEVVGVAGVVGGRFSPKNGINEERSGN